MCRTRRKSKLLSARDRYLVEGQPFKRLSLLLLLAAFIISIPVAQAESGGTGCNTIDYALLKDPQRNKELQVRITYPVTAGRYPVVVFSHGAGGSKNTDVLLTEYWANHGYICLQPTHADSVQLAREQGHQVGFWQVLRGIR